MTEIHWFKEVTRAMALELKGYLGIKSPSKFFGTSHKFFGKDLSKSLEMTPPLDLTQPPHKHFFRFQKRRYDFWAGSILEFKCYWCGEDQDVDFLDFWFRDLWGAYINSDIHKSKFTEEEMNRAIARFPQIMSKLARKDISNAK